MDNIQRIKRIYAGLASLGIPLQDFEFEEGFMEEGDWTFDVRDPVTIPLVTRKELSDYLAKGKLANTNPEDPFPLSTHLSDMYPRFVEEYGDYVGSEDAKTPSIEVSLYRFTMPLALSREDFQPELLRTFNTCVIDVRTREQGLSINADFGADFVRPWEISPYLVKRKNPQRMTDGEKLLTSLFGLNKKRQYTEEQERELIISQSQRDPDAYITDMLSEFSRLYRGE